MIRKAKQTELSSVMQIWLDGNIEAHPFIPTEYWIKNTENVRKKLISSEIYVYENEVDHKVIGFIGLVDNFIGGLFVNSSFRSFGVGEELIRYIKMHKPYLILHVYQKNAFAIQFYEKEGFKISKEITDNDTEEIQYEMIWEK